jgi:hypothetical protein
LAFSSLITAISTNSHCGRSEVIADAMYRVMGPYAIRDIRNAVVAGRYRTEDPDLAWRMATDAIVGFSLRSVTAKSISIR